MEYSATRLLLFPRWCSWKSVPTLSKPPTYPRHQRVVRYSLFSFSKYTPKVKAGIETICNDTCISWVRRWTGTCPFISFSVVLGGDFGAKVCVLFYRHLCLPLPPEKKECRRGSNVCVITPSHGGGSRAGGRECCEWGHCPLRSRRGLG